MTLSSALFSLILAAAPAAVCAAPSQNVEGVPIPECKPAKAYNGAQVWWMTQLPSPDDGGGRTAMALISFPIYFGCAVIDILAYPARAIYNAGLRCSEKNAAMATSKELDREIAKAQQRRARLKQIAARTPPKLTLWAEFDDSGARGAKRNSMLDAEESAQLRISVRNEGPGPAHDVALIVEREHGSSDITLGDIDAIGDMPSGKTRTVLLPITAAEALSRGDLVLRIEAKEELGYDADPILLVVPCLGLPAPELEVSQTAGGEGSDHLELGAPVSLRLRVTNKGEGLAREVKVQLMAEDSNINLAEPEQAALGDISPSGWRDATFQLSLSKQYAGPQDLPVFAVISEKHAAFSKPPQRLPLRLGARMGALSTVVSGKREFPKLQYEVSYQDSAGKGVFESGQELVLTIRVSNTGAGTARGVAVALSGSKSLVELLGGGRSLGDLAPGREETVFLKGVLPSVLPDKASLDVRVSELLGYAPAQIKRLSLSFKSAVPSVQRVVDVDMSPSSSFRAPKRFAVVIGVGKHRDAAVPGLVNARHDAEVVARYLQEAGGLSPDHVRLLVDENALVTDLKEAFEDWLPRQARSAGAEAEIMVYYAGHGTPDSETGGYQLVPFEGSAGHREGLYPLADVYSALGKIHARAAVVLLDSCFSGGGRSLIPSGRPLIPAQKMPLPAHTALLAAASGEQTSNEKKDSRHGLFTYYLLAGLQGEADADREGKVQLGELADYLKRTVPQAATDDLGLTQEPQVRPEPLGRLGDIILSGY